MAKINVNVKIESIMKEKLTEIANQKYLSYPDVVKVALSEYIEKNSKEEKMMVKVQRQGEGTGKGTMVDVLGRQKIEDIIDGLNYTDIIKCAYESYNKGFKTGYATINLETGKVEGLGLGQNESNQAIDNTYITLYLISQNVDFDEDNILTEEELEEGKEMTDEDIIEYLDYSFELDWDYINAQLDSWYTA